MPKHVLVALPLSDAQRSALQASVPEYEFIFAQTETVTLAQVLEADIIMGNVPVELICQNHHLEWFQSNFAGPDTYLVPGVLPEQCLVTNATGAYGLAISEWMLGLWLGLQKDLFSSLLPVFSPLAAPSSFTVSSLSTLPLIVSVTL